MKYPIGIQDFENLRKDNYAFLSIVNGYSSNL